MQNNEIEYPECMDRLSILLYRAKKIERQIYGAALKISSVCIDIYTEGQRIRTSKGELKQYRNSISQMEEFYSSMKSIQETYTNFDENLFRWLEISINRLSSHKERGYKEVIELMHPLCPSLAVTLYETLHVDSELKSPDELKKGKTPKELREVIIRNIETAIDTLIGAYEKVIRIFV